MNTIMERLTYDKLDEAANMLRAAAHPIRMGIIDLLQGEKRLTVTEIYEALNIEQAVASHHLRILKDRGILNSQRDGKNTYYFLKHQRLSQVVNCVERCCGT